MRFTPIVSIVALAVLIFAGVPLLAAVITILGTWVMVAVAAMMTGETNIDPLEQFGLMIGLLCLGLFALLSLPMGYLPAFIIVAFVAVATAVAGDIGHDYKSAKLIGTKAKDIIRVDLIAVVVAGLLAPFVLSVIMDAFGSELFTQAMPAPQAVLVAGSIGGFQNPMIFISGFALAFLWIVAETLSKKKAPVMPMVFGIGMFLGLTLGILLAIGGAIRYALDRKRKGWYYTGLIIAAGVMGGEGLAGFVSAAMIVSGIGAAVSGIVLVSVFAAVLAFAAFFWKKKGVRE